MGRFGIGDLSLKRLVMTVGSLWAKAGHEVRFATRHPDELNNLAKEIGENASIGTNKEAARFGEVVFVAVPFGAWPDLARVIGPEIEGKVVADAGDLYPARDGKMAEDAIKAGGSGVWVELWQGRGPRKFTNEKTPERQGEESKRTSYLEPDRSLTISSVIATDFSSSSASERSRSDRAR